MTNTEPLRLRILKAVKAAIHEVNPSNGYQSDLSSDGSVELGRLILGDSDPVPMVTVVEPPLVIEQIKKQRDNKTRVTEWDLIVQGWVEVSRTKPIDGAYIMAAEIAQELSKQLDKRSGRGSDAGHDFFGFAGKIDSVTIGSPVVRPPEYVSANAQFFLILNLKIVEDMAKPFG